MQQPEIRSAMEGGHPAQCEPGDLRLVFRAPVLLQLPFAGLRAEIAVEGALPVLDAALQDGRLLLEWDQGLGAESPLRTEHAVRLPLAGDPPVTVAVELPPSALPTGRGRVTATLLDGAAQARCVAFQEVAALSLSDLPLRDQVVELPLRGMRLVDLPLRPLGEATRAASVADGEDVRFAMREPSAVVLPDLGAADAAAMKAAGGSQKRFTARSYPLNGLWVAMLRNATVMGQSGLVATPAGLAEESWVGDHPRVPPHYQLRSFQQAWPAEPLRCGDAGMWWGGPWRKLNYYHTHGEAFCGLVQLEMFRDLGGVPDFDILLPDLSGWAREAVDLLGLDARRIRFLGPDCVQPERLYWASGTIRHNVGIEPLLRLVCRRIRTAALAREAAGGVAPPALDGRPEIVYVARTDSPIRPLRNEPELIEALRRRGVRIFVAHGLSYTEQVLVLSRARVVIGPHGAGLTNIGFAEPGALVVEIHPHFYTSPLYFRFAHVLGQRYRAFTAPPGPVPDDPDARAWTIDVQAFLDMLDPLLEAEAAAGRL